MARKAVLVVDDDELILQMSRELLEKRGFRVATASNTIGAGYLLRDFDPDLVVLDILMPKMDGLEFTRRIRSERNIAIIMLTARVEETERIVGLELGADDYVTKPFSPRELVARVRAVLRRTQAPPEPTHLLNAGPITIDRDTHTVTVAGRRVDLTPTEFGLLETLVTTPGRVFRRDELLEAVQGVAFAAYDRTVDVHIKNLRRKIEPDPSRPRLVLTVRGVGYRFNPDADDV